MFVLERGSPNGLVECLACKDQMVCDKCEFAASFRAVSGRHVCLHLICFDVGVLPQITCHACHILCAGEKKLAKVIVPDKWKEGASNTTESGGRKLNENKLLSKKKR